MSIEITREQAELNKRALIDEGKKVRVAIMATLRMYDRYVPKDNQQSCTVTKSLEKLLGQCERTEREINSIAVSNFML